ncbi:MAG: 4-hydroxythreonine-4-phosphate dehydrogenase [Epsilonproteobacteria bacterium]|nr:4-hydroxythreonine-4-phosphate dehydrogenase [Campylobacterota bacterium]
MSRERVAVAVGDLNGIGIELALRNHRDIKRYIEPIYSIDSTMLRRASYLLNIDIPKDFNIVEKIAEPFKIEAGRITKESGAYSFASFIRAVEMAKAGDVDKIVTLPIHKQAWELAGVEYKGHTDALRDIFQKDAIMMLGVPSMFVALYSEHIPLRYVVNEVKNVKKLSNFLIDLYRNIDLRDGEKIALLALNPHAGDGGVLGNEERFIIEAREIAHRTIRKNIFTFPIVPDVAFTPKIRGRYRYFVALYHDQGLAPLKALHFESAINVSLNLPIKRVSVGHGTAFDIAYRGVELNSQSYINAVKY